jgi:hypothetical protein
VERPVIVYLRFLAVFAGRPRFLWCTKRRWNSPLCTSIALKISKNESEVRKLQPLPGVGGCFYKKFSIE